jgi:hypothetical protein
MFRVYSDLLAAAGIKQPVLSVFGKTSRAVPAYLFKRREFPEPFRSRSRLRQNDIQRKVVRDGADATN